MAKPDLRGFGGQLLRVSGLLVCLLLAGQGREDLRLHLFQRLQVRRLLLFDLDDVVAELGLDQVGDLARLQ